MVVSRDGTEILERTNPLDAALGFLHQRCMEMVCLVLDQVLIRLTRHWGFLHMDENLAAQ